MGSGKALDCLRVLTQRAERIMSNMRNLNQEDSYTTNYFNSLPGLRSLWCYIPCSLPWLVHDRDMGGKSKPRKHRHFITPRDNDNDKKARAAIKNETPRKSHSLRLCKAHIRRQLCQLPRTHTRGFFPGPFKLVTDKDSYQVSYSVFRRYIAIVKFAIRVISEPGRLHWDLSRCSASPTTSPNPVSTHGAILDDKMNRNHYFSNPNPALETISNSKGIYIPVH